MYDGNQNGKESQPNGGRSGKQKKNDIKVRSVTGGPLEACFYLLKAELK